MKLEKAIGLGAGYQFGFVNNMDGRIILVMIEWNHFEWPDLS